MVWKKDFQVIDMKRQEIEMECIYQQRYKMTATEIEKESGGGEVVASEDMLELVGTDGAWQRCIFLVALFFAVPSATHNLAMSFLAPNLDHWCARPAGSNWTVQEWKEIGLPKHDQHCSRYQYINVSSLLQENETIKRSDEIVSCDSWEYDLSFYHSTVLSQWDLVCDKQWLVSMSKSIFMAGISVSCVLFGHLADSMGRRPAITAATAIAVFSATICAFSTSFIMFIVTRFFIALGISGVFNIAFVILMEVIGPNERSVYGIAMNFGWCIGFVSLPGIAWVLRDWFWIQIVLSAPCLILLGTWWLLPESPRWLMNKGRVDEAQEILMKAAKVNGKKLSDVETKLKKLMAKATEIHESGDTGGSYIDLLRTPGIWQMTLNIYLLWFVNSFVYYGLSYNTNELAGDPFVNFALSGAVEFPAYFLTMFAIRSMGRRNPLAGAMIVGGVACLLMYVMPADPWWLGTTVSMLGKFCITCSFAIIYVFTTELFPTVVRNIGLGSASLFARFGSIIAPFVRELGSATHPVVPQIVFGILAFVSGLLVFLLPETNKVSVPETLAEAAARGKSKTPKKNVNNHVTVQLSNSDVEKSSVQDEGLTMVCPSPNLQSNDKKLDNVPEEVDHNDPSKNSSPPADDGQKPTDSETGDNRPSSPQQAQDVAVNIENQESDKTNL